MLELLIESYTRALQAWAGLPAYMLEALERRYWNMWQQARRSQRRLR